MRATLTFFGALKTYAFAIVPVIGLLELGAHEVQVHSVVSDADWDAARTAVEADWKPGDLVVFEPFWVDSIGREHFGAKLAIYPASPVVLAAPLSAASWLNSRLDRFGEAPCAFVLGKVSGSVRFEDISWLDSAQLGWRLGIAEP